MGTRGCIARVQGDGWSGIYQNSDSYPTWLGKALWADIQDRFAGDVQAFLVNAIDLHPGGWSQYPDICYCHDEGFSKRDGSAAKDSPYYRRDAPNGKITSANPDPLYIEWVYAFAPERRMMTIFFSTTVRSKPASQPGRYMKPSMTRYQDGRIEKEPAHYYIHKPFQVYPLDGPEPDWKEIYTAAGMIRDKDWAKWDPNYKGNPRRRR